MDRSVQQRPGECSLNPLLRSKSKNQDPPGYDIFYEARPKAPLPNLTGGIIGDDLFSARICPAPEITAQPPSEEQITQLKRVMTALHGMDAASAIQGEKGSDA